MYFSVSKVVSLGGGFLNSNINLKHVFKKPETKKNEILLYHHFL